MYDDSYELAPPSSAPARPAPPSVVPVDELNDDSYELAPPSSAPARPAPPKPAAPLPAPSPSPEPLELAE